MKKNNVYEAPEALVVTIETVDVITTSFSDSNILSDGWLEA